MVCFATKQFVKQKLLSVSLTDRINILVTEGACVSDIDKTPFYVGDIFDNADYCYWFSLKLLQAIIDEHAPLKHLAESN